MAVTSLSLRQLIPTTATQARLIRLDHRGRPSHVHNTAHKLIGMCSQAGGISLELAPIEIT